LVVKLPDVYTDWRVMTGLALIMLGATNWTIGLSRTQMYSQMLATASDQDYATDIRSFDELDTNVGAVLEPFTSEERQVSFATARMDFYHATYLMGRGMVIGGLLLAFWGFIAVIQSDSRRAMRRGLDAPENSYLRGGRTRVLDSDRDG
jgi:hypothetical protein